MRGQHAAHVRGVQRTHPDLPIRVHIGIHTGEAMEEDDDVLGHTVIVASRIADVAGPGEVLVSSLTAQMVERSEEFTFADQARDSAEGPVAAAAGGPLRLARLTEAGVSEPPAIGI